MKTTKDALDVIYPEIEKEPAHKCIKCGRVFKEDDKDYLTFEGNMYIGEDNNFIGDNIPKVDGTDENANKFSREDIHKTRICLACFTKDITEIKDRTINDLKEKAERLIKQIELLNNEKPLDIPQYLKG